MSDSSNRDSEYVYDPEWARLFEMAKSYEEQEEISVYEEIHFYENDSKQDKKYNSPEEALKVLFGYDSFKTGQKSVIDCILTGRDSFAVMPTGAGKSICYQIPAVLLPGITLIISPLISLMQDQVKGLNEAGIPAAYINSSLSERAFSDTIEKARRGLYKIIYVAPERLMTDRFINFATDVDISMVTVDEAHCISQWGQDFRPSYMKIVEFIALLEKRPIISAFTATATKNVQEDIVCILGLDNPYILVTGFDRENLFFTVEKPKDKDQYIFDYIEAHMGESGIIYCATRKNVDNLYEQLAGKNVSVAKYHAGMGVIDRKQMQNDFTFDYKSIIVATNAFGMGIDKSNVRFVIHYNMPQSLENYYQEAGRAGRDGLDSKCILLFSPQDVMINRFLLERKEMAELSEEDKETVKERDAQRLATMERYCYTTDCLRNYILKYFGENPTSPCGDCGNCLREFETLDMTEEAKKIINCVYEAKGRYGKNIIIDTVAGAKTARLEEIGSNSYKSYGVLASSNKNLLKRLVEQLLLEGYLSEGDYRVIKMGNISPLKNPETKVLVKITDEDKKTEKNPGSGKKTGGRDMLSAAGFRLVDRLKELRLSIAREENLPPYIIFSDRTLIDMAIKVPLQQEEMLTVSGVGESKYQKYGQRFICVINSCIKEYPQLLQDKENAKVASVLEGKYKKNKTGKKEFHLLKAEAINFKYSEAMYVSEIRDELNRIIERDNVKKITAISLNDIIFAKNLIEEQEIEFYTQKVPTEKGAELGIKLIDKISEKGNPYTVLSYPEGIQRMLVEHFTREAGDDNSEPESSWLAQKREKHAGAYMPWTKEEDAQLESEFKSGQYTVRDLSEIHGRTRGAISSRLEKLKLIKP